MFYIFNTLYDIHNCISNIVYISRFLRREKALIYLVYKVIYKKLKKYYLRTFHYNNILCNLTIVLDPSIKLDIYR